MNGRTYWLGYRTLSRQNLSRKCLIFDYYHKVRLILKILIITFLYDVDYQLSNACTFSGCLMGKTQENAKVQQYDIDLNGTVFSGLWTFPLHFHNQRGRGAYTRDKEELELKV